MFRFGHMVAFVWAHHGLVSCPTRWNLYFTTDMTKKSSTLAWGSPWSCREATRRRSGRQRLIAGSAHQRCLISLIKAMKYLSNTKCLATWSHICRIFDASHECQGMLHNWKRDLTLMTKMITLGSVRKVGDKKRTQFDNKLVISKISIASMSCQALS